MCASECNVIICSTVASLHGTVVGPGLDDYADGMETLGAGPGCTPSMFDFLPADQDELPISSENLLPSFFKEFNQHDYEKNVKAMARAGAHEAMEDTPYTIARSINEIVGEFIEQKSKWSDATQACETLTAEWTRDTYGIPGKKGSTSAFFIYLGCVIIGDKETGWFKSIGISNVSGYVCFVCNDIWSNKPGSYAFTVQMEDDPSSVRVFRTQVSDGRVMSVILMLKKMKQMKRACWKQNYADENAAAEFADRIQKLVDADATAFAAHMAGHPQAMGHHRVEMPRRSANMLALG